MFQFGIDVFLVGHLLLRHALLVLVDVARAVADRPNLLQVDAFQLFDLLLPPNRRFVEQTGQDEQDDDEEKNEQQHDDEFHGHETSLLLLDEANVDLAVLTDEIFRAHALLLLAPAIVAANGTLRFDFALLAVIIRRAETFACRAKATIRAHALLTAWTLKPLGTMTGRAQTFAAVVTFWTENAFATVFPIGQPAQAFGLGAE